MNLARAQGVLREDSDQASLFQVVDDIDQVFHHNPNSRAGPASGEEAVPTQGVVEIYFGAFLIVEKPPECLTVEESASCGAQDLQGTPGLHAYLGSSETRQVRSGTEQAFARSRNCPAAVRSG